MIDQYKTIKAPGNGIYKEKGSKFISFAYQVNNQEEIREIMDELKKRYHDARHHCYAWVLGPDAVEFRANDDGEPSNSAGKPILGQIQSRELTNVIVVVIRYFGGILLGVGGLIKAYRNAASDALDNCRIIDEKVYDQFILKFSYPEMNSVMKIIKDHGLEQYDQKFDMDCSIRIRCWKKESEKVAEKFKIIDQCVIEKLKND